MSVRVIVLVPVDEAIEIDLAHATALPQRPNGITIIC
jgi:hypothetical protein